MQRKIRVAHIITGLVYGGGGQVVLTVARNIDRTRFEMDVYCVIEGGPIVLEIERMGFPVKVLPKAYDYERIFRYDLRQTFELTRDLKRGRYDVVHTHLYPADVIGRSAAILAGVPSMVKSLHNMGEWKNKGHLFLDKILSRWTSKVICCSAHQRETAIRQEKLSERDVVTIYHGVDIEQFKPMARDAEAAWKLGLNPRRPTVGTVGRLIEAKGQRYLLAAIPFILARHPDTQFVIVGDGPLREPLFASLAGMPYRDRVFFLGERSDIPVLLSLFDVFVFPSLSEGLGIAVLEAMAAQVPVVASNIRPLSEVVLHNQTGFLVKPRDPRDLAAAVDRLLADGKRRRELALEGSNRVRRHFTDLQMVQAIQDIYQDLYTTSWPAQAGRDLDRDGEPRNLERDVTCPNG